MQSNNLVFFALLFLLLKGNVIDTTELLILLTLVSYTQGGFFNSCNSTCNG